MPVALRRVLPCTALVALLLTATACTGLNEANAADDVGAAGDALVADLADRLSGVSSLDYTASYRLAGGATARIAQTQDPLRTAYVYPGGRVVVTADAINRCATRGARADCTVSPPDRAARRLPAESGLVGPEAVLDMLRAAELDAQVEVTRRDTTIAGRPATCLRLRGVDDAQAQDFDVCATSEGVLGSFTGQVDGRDVEVVLTDFSTETDPADFTSAAPAAAR